VIVLMYAHLYYITCCKSHFRCSAVAKVWEFGWTARLPSKGPLLHPTTTLFWYQVQLTPVGTSMYVPVSLQRCLFQVKIIAHARNFPNTTAKMARALREFRVRGVKVFNTLHSVTRWRRLGLRWCCRLDEHPISVECYATWNCVKWIGWHIFHW